MVGRHHSLRVKTRPAAAAPTIPGFHSSSFPDRLICEPLHPVVLAKLTRGCFSVSLWGPTWRLVLCRRGVGWNVTGILELLWCTCPTSWENSSTALRKGYCDLNQGIKLTGSGLSLSPGSARLTSEERVGVRKASP